MRRYITRQLIQLVVVVFGISVLALSTVVLAPARPAAAQSLRPNILFIFDTSGSIFLGCDHALKVERDPSLLWPVDPIIYNDPHAKVV